jgi:hypothetical protein
MERTHDHRVGDGHDGSFLAQAGGQASHCALIWPVTGHQPGPSCAPVLASHMTNGPYLDHPRLRQHHKLGLAQTQFAAEALNVVFADERGAAGNAPGRLTIQRSRPSIDKASPEFRM